ncbi:site-specific integrase [Clostridium sp. BNL1100]|uniref:site-specific integrase n=1 Tax=Clostridium sp. BNL1100 TaxID=755731 RepID=UPI00024A7AA7|nr:site-specific integrase [Clostridium sp. BNL1100]AEY66623.1 phage integrase family protein [Clostridium sp. BNL1100]
MNIDGLIQDFLDSENLSESSKPIYENVLRFFGGFLRENDCKFETLSEFDIFRSLDIYIADRKIKYENTARFYISSVKDFFIFCDKRNFEKNKDLASLIGYRNTDNGFEDKVNIKINSLISTKTISTEKTGVEIDSNELKRLIDECDYIIDNFNSNDLEANIYNGKYTSYISALGAKILSYTGIKVGLLLSLKKECTKIDKFLVIENKKTKKSFSVQIPKRLYKQLVNYRDEIRNRLIQVKKINDNNDFFLIDFNGMPLTNKPFNNLIYEYIGQNKEMGSATARLSKRAIIDMMTAGMSIKIIKDLTGYGDKVLDYCKEKADEIKSVVKDPTHYVNQYLCKRDKENEYYRNIFNIDDAYIKYSISKRYNIEIEKINNKLQQLEDGRIYERTNAKMHGSFANNISQLKEMISDLLYKIEYGEDSRKEELGKEVRDLNFGR